MTQLMYYSGQNMTHLGVFLGYIWQEKTWPNFKWKKEILFELLGEARKTQGKLIVQAQSIGLKGQAELYAQEAQTTSIIEGENLSKDSIRSSIARRLGLPTAGLPPEERAVAGLVEVLMDASITPAGISSPSE